jgi:hypothetical protein
MRLEVARRHVYKTVPSTKQNKLFHKKLCKVKRGEMTGIGEVTRSLVPMVTDRGGNQCSVNSEGEGTS